MRAVPNEPPKTAEELLERYAKGERHFAGAKLSNAHITDATLSHANLIGANLTEANLGSVHLGSANLFGANLFGTKFNGATVGYSHLGRVALLAFCECRSTYPAHWPEFNRFRVNYAFVARAKS